MVVIFMRADPDPFNRIPDNLADGTIVVANPHRKARIAAALELFERQRGVVMVALPQEIILAG